MFFEKWSILSAVITSGGFTGDESAFLINPYTYNGTISTASSPIAVGVVQHVTVSLLDGSLMTVGGYQAADDHFSISQIYNISTQTWGSVTSMGPPTRDYHAAVRLVDGRGERPKESV